MLEPRNNIDPCSSPKLQGLFISIPSADGIASAGGDFTLEVSVHNSRRLAEENKRQDKRIEMLEENVREMRALTNSVERLATSVEDMVKEQEKQGKRLEVLEGRDGEMWRKVVGYIITAVIGIVIGFVFHQIGM